MNSENNYNNSNYVQEEKLFIPGRRTNWHGYLRDYLGVDALTGMDR